MKVCYCIGRRSRVSLVLRCLSLVHNKGVRVCYMSHVRMWEVWHIAFCCIVLQFVRVCFIMCYIVCYSGRGDNVTCRNVRSVTHCSELLSCQSAMLYRLTWCISDIFWTNSSTCNFWDCIIKPAWALCRRVTKSVSALHCSATNWILAKYFGPKNGQWLRIEKC